MRKEELEMSPIQAYLPGAAGKSEIRNPKSEIYRREVLGIPKGHRKQNG
jgi:hypothetical protein